MARKSISFFILFFFSFESFSTPLLFANLLDEKRKSEAQETSPRTSPSQNEKEEIEPSKDSISLEESFLNESESESNPEDEALMREAEMEESLENYHLESIRENFDEMNPETQEQIRDEVQEMPELSNSQSPQNQPQKKLRKFNFSFSEIRQQSINWYRSQLGHKFHLLNVEFYHKISETRPGLEISEEYSLRDYELLFSPRYAFYFSSLFPRVVQTMTGRWGFQIGYSWVYNLDFFRSEETNNGFRASTIIPYAQSIGWRWELSYFPKITPYVDFYHTKINPFNSDFVSTQYAHLIEGNEESTLVAPLEGSFYSLGFLLSFDLLERNFSNKMQEEYGIKDMGLFVEYTVHEDISQIRQAIESRELPEGRYELGFYLVF